ncbi:MAG: phosphoribosyltransferase [gamma proteobacterium symbiont of Taylorina sp.]|nr:phosphoribosyltransferase [gamma proteobacterium symbiont of Taylorina sp.]
MPELYERNDNGPLVKWLIDNLNELRDKVCMLVYPSHIVADSIIRDLHIKNSGSLPTHVIPIHFLSSYSQSSIRIPSLTYDRIRRLIETEKEKNVIFFDDGTITGKVAREIEHLLRNAGATRVYSIILGNRTGLPLYRELIIKTKNYRRNYWRWDVPALGNHRTCPLCKALSKAEIIVNNIPYGEEKRVIETWINTWKLRDVTLDWENHGLAPIPLPDIRKMTFGKEWSADGEISYDVKHTTTTGLASMVIELMRVTSYKAVGMHVLEKPAGKSGCEKEEDKDIWKRVRFEILITQLLLFYDDFDIYELNERFLFLFKLLLNSDESTTEIESLAYFTMLLSEPNNALYIINESLNELSQNQTSSYHSMLTLAHLLSISDKDWLSFIPKKDENNKQDRSLLGENLSYAWFIYAGIDKDPNQVQRSALRMVVQLLGDKIDTSHQVILRDRTIYNKMVNINLLLRDLKLLYSAFKNIGIGLYISDSTTEINPDKFVEEVNVWVDRLEEKKYLSENKTKDIISSLHQWLFNENGLAIRFQEVFLCQLAEIYNYLSIDDSEWVKIIEEKSVKKLMIKESWRNPNSEEKYYIPEIDVIPANFDNNLTIVFSPLIRQVIKDHIINVIHSAKPLIQHNDVGTVDMRCSFTLEDDFVFFKLVNLCSEEKQPKSTTNSKLIQSFQHNKKIEYSFLKLENNLYEFSVIIPIMTVASLGGVL